MDVGSRIILGLILGLFQIDCEGEEGAEIYWWR